MKQITNIKSVYFLGVGGIGMSALARYFKEKGMTVNGYDKTETTLTRQLQAEGIGIHFEDNVALIDKTAELIVYTPAIPKEHKEYNFYNDNGYTVLKRSEVLGMLTHEFYSICVAGTHGKTTTSAMVAHILKDSGYGCNAFLGGIASNYNTNFWSSVNNVSVAEADEYDRSFLKLNPDIAIITSVDPDHLDIYGTEKNLQDAFIEFSGKVKNDGMLISRYGIKRDGEFTSTNKIKYSLYNDGSDAYPENIKIQNGSYLFDVVIKSNVIKNLSLTMGGQHNIENAVAAITVANHLEIGEEKIRKAVAGFSGVKRRFEYIIRTDDMVMIDDYAHHPEELRALILGAKELFPLEYCVVIFQPHLYSRTEDFADGFAEVLGIADEVILLPVYAAREKPRAGVNSEMIAAKMPGKNVKVVDKDLLVNEMAGRHEGLFLIAGAGDIDTCVQPLKDMFLNHSN